MLQTAIERKNEIQPILKTISIYNPRSVYNQIASEYDNSFRSPMAKAEDDVIFGMVKEGYLKGKVLDLGCGTGWLLDRIYEHPYGCRMTEYCGVDLSSKMLEVAKKKHGIDKFVMADMSDLVIFHDKSINSVVSLFGSFSYCLHPDKVVKEIHRVLTPGGKFFVMAYGQRYANRASYILNRKGIVCVNIEYRASELQNIFSASDFENVSIRGFHMLPETVLSSGIFKLPGLDSIPENEGLISTMLKAETNTISRLWPGSCYFLIATGERRVE